MAVRASSWAQPDTAAMENRRHIVSMSGAHDESKTARHVGDGQKREGALNRERAHDGGSNSPVYLVPSHSRSRDTEPRSLHDKEKARIEPQVRFRLDMYHVFAA